MTTIIENSRSSITERTCAEAEVEQSDVLAKDRGSGAFVSERDPTEAEAGLEESDVLAKDRGSAALVSGRHLPEVDAGIAPPSAPAKEMGLGALVSGRDFAEREAQIEDPGVFTEEMDSGTLTRERGAAGAETVIDPSDVVSTEERSTLRRAFDEAEAEIMAITDKETAVVNLEPFCVLIRILGLNSRLRSLRDEAATLPGFDVRCIDRLPTYARALFYVHLSCKGRARKADVRKLVAKVTAVRDRLLADLHSAELRGVPTLRCDFSGNRSYMELGEDILTLVCFFRRKWRELEGKSGLSRAELDEAELLAEEFTFALAARDLPRREAKKRARLRAKAFTLLVDTYEEVRRGISYLRWRQRDQLVPSLYANRIQKRRKRKAPAADTGNKAPSAEPGLAPDVAQG